MASSTRRTAGCGPACPVVWEGRTGNRLPYPDWVARGGLCLTFVRARRILKGFALCNLPFFRCRKNQT
jgi:hypothetical protein